ncbi:MAG TPA: type IX secretion system outer membrane channel protein PorV [Bacteroidales bacterium]
MMVKNLRLLPVSLLILISLKSYSQGKTISTAELNGQMNVVQSAVPFLTIAPDSRAGGMGDVGAATTPDINSMHWNPSKYAFVENEAGVAVSYTPWLRNLVGDIDLATVAGYYRIDNQQVIAGSLVYFSLGEIEFRDINSALLKQGKPNEFSFDLAYARKFGEKFSGSIAFRYIRSDLASGTISSGSEIKAGQAFAADISAYYTNKVKISDKSGKLSFGCDISNIGTKMSYTDELKNKNFLPINLRLGSALSLDLDSYNSMTFAADINKLLIPTPPIVLQKRDGTGDSTVNDKRVILGKEPDVPVVTGMFQSFTDAPGGFKEEMQEINYSLGVEYWYRKQFALRMGYFHEAQNKGNRKYFTFGCGLKLNVFGLDFSYLVPTAANNPLANTLRFTLTFDFDAFRKLKNKQ